MPTLQDVANQIKDDLDQIKSSTALTAARLDTLTQHVDSGVATLAQGLFAVWEVEKQSAALLEDNLVQNETIICWLKTQADLQCRILRHLNTLIDIDTVSRDALIKLEKIVELVHAREALEVEHLAAADAKIDACCPPEKPEPEPCYEPCREGEIQRYRPKGQEWRPPEPPVGKKLG